MVPAGQDLARYHRYDGTSRYGTLVPVLVPGMVVVPAAGGTGTSSVPGTSRYHTSLIPGF
jgi:hypothetical protein